MAQYPLTILTIFHPEHWLGMSIRQLSGLPHQRRDREAMEAAKRQVANDQGLDLKVREFHERPIQNFGESVDRLRKTWLEGLQTERLIECIGELKPKLCVYTEKGSQARYRIECRYGWGSETNSLPSDAVFAIRNKMLASSRISVRQVWLNKRFEFSSDERMPEAIREYPLPKEIENSTVEANLIVGPYVVHDALRRAELTILKSKRIWWLDV